MRGTGDRTELRLFAATLADMIWEREQVTRRSDDTAMLGYVQDAVVVGLGYRRRMEELDRRLAHQGELTEAQSDCGSADSAGYYVPARSQPKPRDGGQVAGRTDWLVAMAIGITAGLILRTAFVVTMSRAEFLLLGATVSEQPQMAMLLRLWLLGGILVVLGTGALVALLARTRPVLWILLSMACVALPLLIP